MTDWLMYDYDPEYEELLTERRNNRKREKQELNQAFDPDREEPDYEDE